MTLILLIRGPRGPMKAFAVQRAAGRLERWRTDQTQELIDLMQEHAKVALTPGPIDRAADWERSVRMSELMVALYDNPPWDD